MVKISIKKAKKAKAKTEAKAITKGNSKYR